MNSGKDLVINGKTKIKVLLAVDQEAVISALVELNKNFRRLKNPLLRKLFAGRVTIADACKVAGCRIPDFLEKMEHIGFQVETVATSQSPEHEQPAAFFVADAEIIDLDVRPVLQANKDPLKVILQHVNSLKPGQSLKVINTFIPVPLINLLQDKGFSHYVETVSGEQINTYFKKGDSAAEPAPADIPLKTAEPGHFDQVLGSVDPGKVRYIDVRDQEMPQPMLKILASLETLGDGEVLFVYHKKVPVFLLPQLQEKGYDFLFKDSAGEKVNMLIFKS